MRVIHQENNYRITEIPDEHFNLSDLKGECFDASVNTDIHADQLAEEEKTFELLVYSEGVYGYSLEKLAEKCPTCGSGDNWEHIDSCWGFVGQYDNKSKKFNHYIVEELVRQIKC